MVHAGANSGPPGTYARRMVSPPSTGSATPVRNEAAGNAKLSVPLLPLLYLSVGFDAFAVRREGLGWGASYDTTIGLRLHLDAARQAL